MPDWFEALGEPVPDRRRDQAYELLADKWGLEEEKGADSVELFIDEISIHVKLDEPEEALDVAQEWLDLTGAYRLMAYLCVDDWPVKNDNAWGNSLMKDGPIDFDSVGPGIEPGDKIEVVVRPFIHEPDVFTDLDDETEEIRFTVNRITTPSHDDTITYLWEAAAREKNSEHWNMSNRRDVCHGTGIDWYAEEVRWLGA